MSRAAALGVVAVLVAALTGWLGAPAATAATVAAGDVQLAITDVTPNSPTLTLGKPRPLDITLKLTNTTDAAIDDVIVSAERGDPIFDQRSLDRAIAKPRPPSPSLVSPLKATATADVPAGATVTVAFHTTTDINVGDADLCLCANAIYPLYFTAAYVPKNGPSVRLDTAQTYVPSFTAAPRKARIGWVWPLLDRPHRLTQDNVFTDDDLADEVRTGGRLDQLLTVVEQVAGQVPMTLVTDPELIDELAVMAGVGTTSAYRVTSGTHTVVGTGVDAAKAWLDRLSHVLTAHPDMELSFTPPADPAVESLTENGLSWTATLSAAEQTRITQALGLTDTPLSDIAWPADGVVSQSTLTTLAADGTKTVVLSDKTLPRGSGRTVIPDAIAPLTTDAGTVHAAVTSSPIERAVSSVLAPDGAGLAALPQLVAQLALRVVISDDRSHFVLITPPRNLTVDPDVATTAILATSVASWAAPLPLREAGASVRAVDHGRLRPVDRTVQLPAKAVAAIQYVTAALPGLARFYDPTDPGAAAARTALDVVPPALQRCESTSLLLQDPAASTVSADRLQRRIRVGIQDKVHLVSPTNGTYTLTSKKSNLPVTIVNQLAVAVQVRINVTPSVPGLSVVEADKVRSIKANSKVQIPLATKVERPGRIAVTVTLSTPDGLALGTPISLTVHSTALGTIGVVITVVAAIVLVLALLVRFIRQLQRRRRRQAPLASEDVPVPPAPATAP